MATPKKKPDKPKPSKPKSDRPNPNSSESFRNHKDTGGTGPRRPDSGKRG